MMAASNENDHDKEGSTTSSTSDELHVQQNKPQHLTTTSNPENNSNNKSSGISIMRRITLANSSTTVDVSSHPITVQQVDHISALCGLIAGVAQAGIFNPIDRALYLSVTHRKPFLSLSNFEKPFTGLSQSIGGRALSGGLYFPLEQFFMTHVMILPPNYHDNLKDNSRIRNLFAGTAAGAVNAMILNPLSAIKYKTWSRVGTSSGAGNYTNNRGMLTEAMSMMQKGGHVVFLKGMQSTLLRDITFGGCYTFFRLQLQYEYHVPPEHQWIANLCAAAMATIVSGPFNLARNVQYATKSEHVAPTTIQVFQQLKLEIQQYSTIQQKLLHLQNRLRIGWGTARVAMGISFGHAIYDGLHSIIRPIP